MWEATQESPYTLPHSLLCCCPYLACLQPEHFPQMRRRRQCFPPYDHIHLNEPANEASVWWEKNIPGGRRITEVPNRTMYGAVRLLFLGARNPAAGARAV